MHEVFKRILLGMYKIIKLEKKKNFLNNTILWHIILSNYLTYDINLMVGLEITELRDPTHRSSIPEINFKR